MISAFDIIELEAAVSLGGDCTQAVGTQLRGRSGQKTEFTRLMF